MNFIVSSSLLSRQLQSISGVLIANNTLPILDDFLFSVKKRELKISASDLETTVITSVPVESKDTENIAIPARFLLNILKTFPEQPLTFNIDNRNFAIEISSQQGKYKLVGHEAEDFPKIPEIENAASFEMDASMLASAVNKTLVAVGDDELRHVMCGVFVHFESDKITFVSTDSHKLVRYTCNNIKVQEASSFIIPQKPLNLLKNILPAEGKVKVDYNKTNVSFAFGNTFLICRLIDGKYPNYSVVIPQNNPNKLIIDRKTFLNSINRVSIFSDQSTYLIRFQIKDNKLNISTGKFCSPFFN